MNTAAILLIGVIALAGCTHSGASGTITVSDPAVGAVPGESAAVYLTIANRGGDDALVGAECTCADTSSLHVVTDHDGILMMEDTEEVPLPSGSTTVLDPGRSHLMLEGLDDSLEAGGTVTLTLEFAHTPQQTVDVPVVALEELADRVEQVP